MKTLLGLTLWFSLNPYLEAASPTMAWQQTQNSIVLTLNLKDALSPQQKKLLFSGFTTFSHLEVRLHEENGLSAPLLFVSECTIQYDLWEEKFDLLHFLDSKKPDSLRSLQEYNELCLTASLQNVENLRKLETKGRRLDVRLDIAQVSNDFAKNVRQWLIQQQSGVMRGLFSHMLGELKLNETVSYELEPPPLLVQKGNPRGKL